MVGDFFESRVPLLKEDSDEELLKRIAKRDENALELLIDRHEDNVYRLLFRLFGDKEEAQDNTQEIFIFLWENPFAWKPKARFSSWLYRITYNRALNILRSRKIKSFFSIGTSSEKILENLPTEDPNPHELLIQGERQEKFNRMYNGLAPKLKAALHLKYWEKLSTKEIALSLGVSYRAAESLIFRAKKLLREVL